MNFLTIKIRNEFKFKLKTFKIIRQVPVYNISSYSIRKRFLDYFIVEHDHNFIRSSPVVPYCDKTVAFVNAGMNQFKGIFLGDLEKPCPRAANSQKCIRVGGKHNDLNAVGHDSYHHTFFEMLGNWSFGDYFKQTACELSWKLLTTAPFSLDPKRLYVTYFGGDERLGMCPDLETKDIWRSIGVHPDRIVPFGVKDNFWEMGLTGPCGPCSEIHYDHVGNRLGSNRVNQGYSDLTELWNIVFIQYNRNEDESLSTLPDHHVDTGMGFERLVALLQHKQSNYDTDLFIPLFETITKTSKAKQYGGKFGKEDFGGVDTSYRILADHTRMITVALADHMFPDHNHKLRRILRKALLVAEKNFKMKNGAELVKAVSNQVAEILSPTYPEIGTNLKQVHFIIDHEYDLFKVLKGSSAKQWQELIKQDSRLAALTGYEAPGLPAGYKELITCLNKSEKVLTGDLAFHLYDTHGLDPDTMEDLSELLGLEFMRNDFESRLAKVKEHSRVCFNSEINEEICKVDIEKLKAVTQKTDDNYKYIYTRDNSSKVPKYFLNQLEAKIEAVILKDKLTYKESVKIKPGDDIAVILNKTCFYSEAGGQESDQGTIVVLGNRAKQMFSINVKHVENCAGYIVHYGQVSTSGQSLPEYELEIGNKAYLAVDIDRRVGNMCNHTTTHLLNAAIRQLFTVTCQKASKVTHNQLELQFSLFRQSLSNKDLIAIEEMVRRVIISKVPVSRSTVCVTDLLAMSDVNLLPGEVYPQDQIHLIEIVDKDFISKEACCGTHVLNTSDISEICVTNVRSQGQGNKVIQAVTGAQAVQSITKGQKEFESINALATGITTLLGKEALDEKQMKDLDDKIQVAKKNINNKGDLPYAVRFDLLTILDDLLKKIKDKARISLRKSLGIEMRAVLAESGTSPYIVHFLQCSSDLDNIPLQKATKLCPDLPVTLFAYSDGHIKARCCVPEKWVNLGLTAENWMDPVLSTVGGVGGPPRGQDPRLVYLITSRKISQSELETTVDSLITVAKNIVSNFLK